MICSFCEQEGHIGRDCPTLGLVVGPLTTIGLAYMQLDMTIRRELEGMPPEELEAVRQVAQLATAENCWFAIYRVADELDQYARRLLTLPPATAAGEKELAIERSVAA